MPASQTRNTHRPDSALTRELKPKRHRVLVQLTDEQLAATEGWRSAHGFSEQSEALGELIRLGLLSEIAKIYRLVSELREPADMRTSRFGSGRENEMGT